MELRGKTTNTFFFFFPNTKCHRVCRPADITPYMMDIIVGLIQVGTATSPPASPKLSLTHKPTVSNHTEAGGQCIWVSHIDLSPSLHGSGVRFCVLTRGFGGGGGGGGGARGGRREGKLYCEAGRRRRTANRLIHRCTQPREPSLTSGQSHDPRRSITHIKKT